jgi:DNA-binding NarL/FixJ family response regulator
VDEVRVLLVDLPRMLREIVRNVLDAHAGVTVVDHASVQPRPTSLVEAVDRARADVVITGKPDQRAAVTRTLLEQRPRVQLIAVSEDGRHTTVSGLRPYREPLGEVEPDQLVEAIRGVAAAAARW